MPDDDASSAPHQFRSGYIAAELACDPELPLAELAVGESVICSAAAVVGYPHAPQRKYHQSLPII